MNKKVIIWGAVIVGGILIYHHMTKKSGNKTAPDTKSNASGSTKDMGPCQGSQASPQRCSSVCEQLGGSYDSVSRMCNGVPAGASSPLFGSGPKTIGNR